MAGKKKSSETVEYRFRAVLFQYKEKPAEWHVACVENGACGWGPNPDAAVRELQATIQGQIQETFRTGKNFFFAEPDEEWLRAFETGAPPSDDLKLISRLIGHLEILLHGKPEQPSALRLEIVPAQPA